MRRGAITSGRYTTDDLIFFARGRIVIAIYLQFLFSGSQYITATLKLNLCTSFGGSPRLGYLTAIFTWNISFSTCLMELT